MSELASTGHPLVDALRDVQIEINSRPVDPYDDESLRAKCEYVEQRIQDIGAAALQGQRLFVQTRGLWVPRPEPDPTTVLFNQPYSIDGSVDTIMYLLAPGVFDNLALRFLPPDVLNIPVEERTPFTDRPVDVHVSAIDSCRPPVAA